jgi:hypothetical protein
VVLGESMTSLKITGLACTVAGVVLLAPAPARYGVNPEARAGQNPPSVRAFVIVAGYIVIIGVGAFLEKPALRGLDGRNSTAWWRSR